MKKIDLLHTTILIVAILCGYSALRQILSLLNVSFYISDIFFERSGYGAAVAPVLIHAAVYVVACIVLVKNGERIAIYLLGNRLPEYEEFLEEEESNAETNNTRTVDPVGADTGNSDQLEWRLDRQSILFAFFIGLGLYTLIEYVPDLLDSVIKQFGDKAGNRSLLMPSERRNYRDYLLLDGLRVTVGALLIYAAPTLTNYIERTIATRLQTESKTT